MAEKKAWPGTLRPSSTVPQGSLIQWLHDLSDIISHITDSNIFSAEFLQSATALVMITTEIKYTLLNPIDRSVGSVYDRPDYVTREFIRTSRVIVIESFFRQLSEALMQKKATFDKDGQFIYDSKPVNDLYKQALLVSLPAAVALSFTASETVGIISIDDVLHIAHAMLTFSSEQSELVPYTALSQPSIIAVAMNTVSSCIINLSVLNGSLFFSMIADLEIMALLVKAISTIGKTKNAEQFRAVVSALSLYIQTPQADPDLKRKAADQEFVKNYMEMMEKVVNPIVSANRDSRASFRPILHYSRSLKLEPKPDEAADSHAKSAPVEDDE